MNLFSLPELAASCTYAVSVLLAARNSVHTWWIGIVGCMLYAWVFFTAKLYADVTLQGFFIVTSVSGWIHWLRGDHGSELSIRRTSPRHMAALACCALFAAAAYAALLHRFTDAWSPWLDSLILSFSIFAQFMLMGRRIENWYVWLFVNTIAVPLYAWRGLYLTAGLYFVFWFNAWYGLHTWRRKLVPQ